MLTQPCLHRFGLSGPISNPASAWTHHIPTTPRQVMEMETRLHPRETVDLNVNLMRKGDVLASAKAIDVSRGGIAIEGPELSLNKGQILDVKLSRSDKPNGKGVRTRAMVIHTEGNRIGLMFADQVPWFTDRQ